MSLLLYALLYGFLPNSMFKFQQISFEKGILHVPATVIYIVPVSSHSRLLIWSRTWQCCPIANSTGIQISPELPDTLVLVQEESERTIL